MCDQTHSLGLCETDFVHSVELSPALGEVDTFFVFQFITGKVDESEILEVETTVKEEGEGRGGQGRKGRGRAGKGRGGEGRRGEERGGEGRRGEGLTSVCGRVGTDSGSQGMEEREWMLFSSHVRYAGWPGSCKGISVVFE